MIWQSTQHTPACLRSVVPWMLDCSRIYINFYFILLHDCKWFHTAFECFCFVLLRKCFFPHLSVEVFYFLYNILLVPLFMYCKFMHYCFLSPVENSYMSVSLRFLFLQNLLENKCLYPKSTIRELLNKSACIKRLKVCMLTWECSYVNRLLEVTNKRKICAWD